MIRTLGSMLTLGALVGAASAQVPGDLVNRGMRRARVASRPVERETEAAPSAAKTTESRPVATSTSQATGRSDDEQYRVAFEAYRRKDYAASLALFLPLAEKGNVSAQAAAGQFYRDGLGVPQAYAEALRWYRKAAAQGDAASMNTLAICYSKGYGVRPDQAEAAKWHRSAAERGHADSAYDLGVRLLEARGAANDPAEASRWFTAAANQGHESAQFNLGTLYRDGNGVPADRVQAAKWLKLAARNGSSDAMRESLRVSRGLSEEQRAEVKRLVEEWKPGGATAVKAVAAPVAGSPAAQTQAEAPQFRNKCFSNVCLGDDLDKVGSLNLVWMPESAQAGTDPRNLREVRAAFRGLTEGEYKILAAATRFGAGARDKFVSSFIPDPAVHLVLDNATVTALKRSSACSGLPVHGLFKSESGHYTSLVLLPEQGKLKVAKLARRWMLSVPAAATGAQRDQIINQQLNDLVKQVRETYGNSWVKDTYFVQPITMSARDNTAVGYFDWQDSEHPLLTFYSTELARFQGQQGNAGSPISWDRVVTSYEQNLSRSPACSIQASQVKLD